MVYTWSFAAATPSFRCRLSNDDSVFDNPLLLAAHNRTPPTAAYCKANMKISVKECQRCYTTTTTSDTGEVQIQPCDKYVFDRKYHKYTLVEEVRVIVVVEGQSRSSAIDSTV